MNSSAIIRKLTVLVLGLSSIFLAGSAFPADIKGQVLGAGAPIAQSTVTLWAASAGAPKQVVQTKTDKDGRFAIHGTGAPDTSLYLVATGGVSAANPSAGNNPAIALLTVVGSNPPARVVINEFTTIASVVTHAQFIDNTTIKGSPLQLRIAAGNVPNFVDLETGSWGPIILDALNSAQTPTMANFGTLANVMAGCITLGEARCVHPIFRGDYASQRRRSAGYSSCDGSGRILPLAPAGQDIRVAQLSFIRCPSPALPASFCGIRRTCRISRSLPAPSCSRLSSQAVVSAEAAS